MRVFVGKKGRDAIQAYNDAQSLHLRDSAAAEQGRQRKPVRRVVSKIVRLPIRMRACPLKKPVRLRLRKP